MKPTQLAKKMILIICVLMLIFMAASAIYYRSLACLPFIYGCLLGGALSSYKVILLDKTVDKALGLEQSTADNYVKLQHLLRFFLSAAVLVAAALVPAISLWGAVAGVFSFQLSLYVLRLTEKFSEKN
ncbi:MAG: hypothetical protein GX025_02590 [Clostridiales bacterium]|nr:hypothetical protein [Clostridiales bacterium]